MIVYSLVKIHKYLTNRIQHFENPLNINKITAKAIYFDTGPKCLAKTKDPDYFQGFYGK